MRKFVLILLAVCLILGGVTGYLTARHVMAGSEESVSLYDPESITWDDAEDPTLTDGQGAENGAIVIRQLDLDALHALCGDEEIVGNVDGSEVTWEEYFYWLADMGTQAQSYIMTMAYYGQSLDWNDQLSSDSEQTFAEYVVEMAQECVRQLNTIETVAEENGVTLSEESLAGLQEKLEQDILDLCGEGADEETFNAYLAENNISRGMYDRLNRVSFLFNDIYTALYGEDGANITEEDALAYLNENNYLCAGHILFLTIDPNTYEAVGEEEIAQKLAQAEAVSAELRAIEDPDERAARFAELKEQYCEDTGREMYPEGYLFVPGEMVTEFEDAVKGMEDYQVSEPVLSAWGYHVIMRLPLDVDMTLEYNDAGAAISAREKYANALFNELLGGRIEGSTLTLRDDIAAIDLTDYLD